MKITFPILSTLLIYLNKPKYILTLLLLSGFMSTYSSNASVTITSENYKAIKKKFPKAKYVINHRKVTVLFRKNNETNQIEAIKKEYNELLSLEKNITIKRNFYYDNFSTVSRISKKKFFETRGDINEQNIFHSDSKFCTFSKYVNDAAESIVLEVETVYKDARFYTTEYLTTEIPVISFEFHMEFDTSLNVKYKLNSNDNEAYNINQEQRESNYYVSFKADSLKSFKHEVSAVPYKFNYDHIQIRVPYSETSSIDVQQNIYTFINNYTKQTEIDTSALRPLLNEILTQNEDKDPIRVIYNWVRKNIRYIAFEYALGGYIPESPNKVAKDRYSDCKGMAFLLKTFLKMEGFDARLSWISAQPTIYSSSFPSISNYDHMICAVMQDKEPLFLDATSSYSTFGLVPEYLQGKETLIQDGDNYQLYTIPVAAPSQNAMIYNYDLSIINNEAEGNLIANIYGNRKAMASGLLNESGQTLNLVNKTILFWGDKSIETKSNDIIKEENDSLIHYSQKVGLKGSVLQNRSNYYIIPNPSDVPNISKIDTTTERDIYKYIKDSLVVKARWNLPDGYRVKQLPTDTTLYGPIAKMTYQYEQTDSTLDYTRIFVRNKVILPTKQISAYNKFVNKVLEENKKRIILTR